MIKKALILGAGGMVGKNLVEHAPSGIALLTPAHDELDLLSYNDVLEYFKTHNPDMIIHAAGIVGGIQANIARPVKFLLENADMGRNVAWAAYNAGIDKMINFGSSCMYPRDAKNPLKESMILSGELEPTNEGYALAKIFTQRLCSYINRQFDAFNYKTVIPCNLYGKYDTFDPEHSHMIPAVIRKIHAAKIHAQKTVEIWGEGTARREFMYATDLANMIWKYVSDFENMPELMNLGLGHDHSINEYYHTIAGVIGYTGKFVHDKTKPVGMKQKLVDVSLQKEHGLAPANSLKEGIEKTYAYYLKISAE
ncbi:MAG: NAD-dependent epimerase/dehydratase family protein [Bacteroidales bacterium]